MGHTIDGVRQLCLKAEIDQTKSTSATDLVRALVSKKAIQKTERSELLSFLVSSGNFELVKRPAVGVQHYGTREQITGPNKGVVSHLHAFNSAEKLEITEANRLISERKEDTIAKARKKLSTLVKTSRNPDTILQAHVGLANCTIQEIHRLGRNPAVFAQADEHLNKAEAIWQQHGVKGKQDKEITATRCRGMLITADAEQSTSGALNRLEEALEAIEQSVLEDPNDTTLRNMLGYTYLRLSENGRRNLPDGRPTADAAREQFEHANHLAEESGAPAGERRLVYANMCRVLKEPHFRYQPGSLDQIHLYGRLATDASVGGDEDYTNGFSDYAGALMAHGDEEAAAQLMQKAINSIKPSTEESEQNKVWQLVRDFVGVENPEKTSKLFGPPPEVTELRDLFNVSVVGLGTEEGIQRLQQCKSQHRTVLPALADEKTIPQSLSNSGLGSLCMVLNDLNISLEGLPEATQKALLDRVDRGHRTDIQKTGITLRELSVLAKDCGAIADVRHAGKNPTPGSMRADLDTFRQQALESLENPSSHMIVNYKRDGLGPGNGVLSPIQAYDEKTDSFLLFDGHPGERVQMWVPTDALHRAMCTPDKEMSSNRGYVVIAAPRAGAGADLDGAAQAAASMKLDQKVELRKTPKEPLVKRYTTALVHAEKGDNTQASVSKVFDEIYNSGEQRGDRLLGAITASTRLDEQGKAQNATKELMKQIEEKYIAFLGFGSIMDQPSNPDQIECRMFGKIFGWKRTADIAAWRRGAATWDREDGPAFKDNLAGDGTQGFLLTRDGHRHLFYEDGKSMAIGLGLGKATPEEFVDVCVDLYHRYDDDGNDISDQITGDYDKREGSAFPNPDDNFYQRQTVEAALGPNASALDGYIYVTNEGGTFHRPGMTLEQVAERVHDATKQIDLQPRNEGQKFLAEASEVQEQIDALSEASGKTGLIARKKANRQLQLTEQFVRDHSNIDLDTGPGKRYHTGVAYWGACIAAMHNAEKEDPRVAEVAVLTALKQMMVDQKGEKSQNDDVAVPVRKPKPSKPQRAQLH